MSKSSEFPSYCRECPVWKKSLFKDFDEQLLYWLGDSKQPVTKQKKDVLFSQGETVKGLYCHLSGLTKVVQTDAVGDVRFSRLVLPGDTSGHRSIFVEEQYKGTAKVISDELHACFIPKPVILSLLANNAAFAKNLVVKIATDLNRLEEQTISAKERPVSSRLASLLLQLCDQYAEKTDSGQYVLHSEITKKDISNVLLVANETVIRIMSDMKADGLISYQEKRIIINDYEKLKKIAELDLGSL